MAFASERLAQIIKAIFGGGCRIIASDEAELLAAFDSDPIVRKEFVLALNQQRAIQKKVDSGAFDELVLLIRGCFRACEAHSDFAVGKNLVNMTATFYRGEGVEKEFLQARLRDEKLLHDVRLWEELFFDQIAAEKRRMEAGIVFSALPPDEQQEAIMRFRNVVFGQLGTFLFNMLECGVDVDNVRQFARKMCAASELSGDDEEQLMASVAAAAAPIAAEHPVISAVTSLLSGVPLTAGALAPPCVSATLC
jgi:hypothetical protein